MSEQEKAPEQPTPAQETPTGAGPDWAPEASAGTAPGTPAAPSQTPLAAAMQPAGTPAGAVPGAPAAPNASPSAGQFAAQGQQPYPGAAQPTAGQAGPGAQPWATSGQQATGQAPTGQAPTGQAPTGQAPGAQPTQSAPPGYWPQGWPTPLGSPYAYAGGGPVPPNPGAVVPTATTSWWKRPAVFVTSLVLAFLLGMGSFALGARVWSVFNPQDTQPSRVPSGTSPWYPGNRGQAPDQQQPNDQQSGGQDVQPRSATLPTDAQSKGIVLIEASSGNSLGAGTGMVLTADGKVLTNYHVVAGSEKVSVTLADTGDTYEATVVGFDQTRDVALLQLANASNLPTVTVDDDSLAVGDTVSAVGNAEGGGELVRADGQVTGIDQDLTVSSDSPWGAEEDLNGLIQTDANAVPGDSGGPMFDSENEVTGMTTAGSVRAGDSYAIPIASALQVVQVIEAGKDSGTVRVGPAGYLGIVVADATRGSRSSRVITQVVEDSPAGKAGIEVGSTLTSVNGTKITSSTNLADVIRVLEPGQQVKVEWTTPDGDAKSADVTLGASPIN